LPGVSFWRNLQPELESGGTYGMAQYEQKIDSREFEVASADQYSSASTGDAPADSTEIVVRVWGAEPNVALTWKTENVLVYMIADLVGVSAGRVAEAASTTLAAHFDSSRQALVAAKRIQTSILEFVPCRPGERIAAAILIYRPRSSDLTGFSVELVRLALANAKPGQILLAENVSQHLRGLPGIEFRAVAGLTGDEATGLSELMWTTPERLALLANSVVDVAVPRSSDSPPLGATLIVHSPITRRTSSNEAVRPVMGDFVVKDLSETASQRAGQIPDITQDRAPVFEGFRESQSSAFTDGLDEFGERPLITRTRVILGIVALVLVAAIIAVLFRPGQVSKRPLPAQQDQTVGTESPDKQPPTVASEPEAKEPQPGPTTDKPQAKVPVVVSQPQTSSKAKADNRVKNKRDSSEEPAALEEYGGYSLKDIPTLLEFAKTDAGKGNYVNARREYSTILKLQPKNQEAKEGLYRLDLIQKDRQ
jgi:hypothetical protein